MQIKIPSQAKPLALYSMISLMILAGLYATFHLTPAEALGARIADDQLTFARASAELNAATADAQAARDELSKLFPQSRNAQ